MSLSTKVATLRRLYQAGVAPANLVRLALHQVAHVPVDGIRMRNGVAIVAPPSEPLLQIFKEIWLDRTYAENDLGVMTAKAVVDIGAHVGVFALWVAANNPHARVICLEPSPHLFPFLQRNISANGLSNIECLQAACGGSARQATLYFSGQEWGNSLYGGDQGDNDSSQGVMTSVVTLADLFDRFKITTCDFIKMDCEGAEYETLLNADRDTLARIRAITLEYHLELGGGALAELESYLRSNGFSVKSVPTDVNRGYLYASNEAAPKA
jgi:FkbM family methyltransferase